MMLRIWLRGVCFVYLRAGTVRINFLKNAFFNSEYERIDGFQWFALHGKYLCIIDCWHAFVVCPGELTESITSAFHLLPLPITVPTRFRAILHHEWISRCVSRKPCSKQWTVTSDKNSAVQTIKTGRSPVLKWDWNCWDGSWNCQEIAGKCLPAGCSTAGLHLERTSNWRTSNVMSWADSCSWWAERIVTVHSNWPVWPSVFIFFTVSLPLWQNALRARALAQHTLRLTVPGVWRWLVLFCQFHNHKVNQHDYRQNDYVLLLACIVGIVNYAHGNCSYSNSC